jgi:hypothetical protein
MDMAAKWEELSLQERTELLKNHATNGFKRHSVILQWPNFDMVRGFCLDVMHQLDEGVARYILHLLIEKDSPLGLNAIQVSKIDSLWRSIVTPGHENRKLRSIREYKAFKAHELRFFVQHGLPYITTGIVPKNAYKVFCLASCIAWTCTKDEITPTDVENLKDWCRRFMVQFEAVFTDQEMKFSIHLMSHIWFAVTLFGPLQNVSCYGPEDHIGKISRKILSMYNTSKHVMNTFVLLTKSSLLVEEIADRPTATDWKVVRVANRILGRRCAIFEKSSDSGSCRLIGKPIVLSSSSTLLTSLRGVCKAGINLARKQVYLFKAAVVDIGFRIRTAEHNQGFSRNESVIIDENGDFMEIIFIFAVLNAECTAVEEAFVSGLRLVPMEKSALEVGTKSVPVAHVVCVRRSEDSYILNTTQVYKQFVILKQSGNQFFVSVPSSVFCTT